MKVSLNWLKEYVDIGDDYKLLKDSYNLMSQEVEGLYKLVDINNLFIGKVLTCIKHPDADKLSVTTVDVGDEVLQIICGAPNVAVDQKVIVSKVGSVLPGNFKIKKSKIRGIESNGMICSLEELGVKEFDAEETGIYVLDPEAPIGGDPLAYMHLDDYVLDLDLTANRADLLSMEGVAYDTAAMLDKDIKIKKHKYDKKNVENSIKVFTDTKMCHAYYCQVIDNIKIKQSPYWLKSRLIAAGIRPINNVVDITNYVMIEYGQPMHAFDYNKLKSDEILIRHAKEGETIVTLDEQERKLLATDIVITDGRNPIAIAGVMGGLSTEVDGSTTKILLESACFDPICVRKTSKRLDLKSESSSRFEKGIDSDKIDNALHYATELFISLADGEVLGEYSFFDNCKKEPHYVELTLEKLNSITGHTFANNDVESILKRLRFNYREKNNLYRIEVPTRRKNVYGYQDVIEEIVRIFGYNKIPLTIPKTPTTGYLTAEQKLRRTVRNYFVNNGFNEIVSYSLVTPEQAIEFDLVDLPTIEILNPINKEKNLMRHSLLPSLLEILKYNQSRKISDIFLFEIGRSYFRDKEVELLSGVLTGVLSSNLWQGQKEVTDFYLLKGIIETLLAKLNIEDFEIVKTEKPISKMHPGICADLLISNEYIGYIGKLHPQKEFDLSIDKTYVFELNFEMLSKFYQTNIIMQDIPKYPTVSRDLAIVVGSDIQASDVIKEAKIAGKKTLKQLEIFDVYQGKNVDVNEKSIAMSLTFQNSEKTLETKEIDIIVNRILKHLEKTINAKLRQF